MRGKGSHVYNSLFLHGALLVNAVLAMLAMIAAGTAGWRGGLFDLVLALGATEAGWWLAAGILKILPARKPGPWSLKTDRPGCLIVMAAGAVMVWALIGGDPG